MAENVPPDTTVEHEREEPAALKELQSTKQRELLDVIDQLRSLRVDEYQIDLPQLVVVGDQSSGKSAVLNAISGVRFPSKEGTCTTFATEVIMRNAPHRSGHVSIVPGNCDDDAQLERQLKDFTRTCSSIDEVSTLIADATKVIQDHYGDDRLHISDHTLRVEVRGPDMPPLTLVDLPGIIHSTMKSSAFGIKEKDAVLQLVERYLRNKLAIILTVASAAYDSEIQEVFDIIKKYDPTRNTFGIITHPDAGTSSVKRYITLAMGNKLDRQEWHVLRNRSEEEMALTAPERDEKERSFFNTHLGWSKVPKDKVGAAALRVRLSSLLQEKVWEGYRRVKRAIQKKLAAAEREREGLGDPRPTIAEQRDLLNSRSRDFEDITKSVVDGRYSGLDFFTRLSTAEEQDDQDGDREMMEHELRAVIDRANSTFANNMWERGHYWDIQEVAAETMIPSRNRNEPKFMPLGKLFQLIESRATRAVKPNEPREEKSWVIMRDLFVKQCTPWRRIAEKHIEDVADAVASYLETVTDYLAKSDQALYENLCNYLVGTKLEEKKEEMKLKLDEVLRPWASGWIHTYDHKFLADRNMEKAQRSAEAQSELFKLNKVELEFPKTYSELVKLEWVKNPLSKEALRNYEIYDSMKAHYKRARSQFVDNMTLLVVEGCLLAPLHKIFTIHVVARMSDADIAKLASESPSTVAERARVDATIKVLGDALELFGTSSPTSAKAKRRFQEPEVESTLRDSTSQGYNDDGQKTSSQRDSRHSTSQSRTSESSDDDASPSDSATSHGSLSGKSKDGTKRGSIKQPARNSRRFQATYDTKGGSEDESEVKE